MSEDESTGPLNPKIFQAGDKYTIQTRSAKRNNILNQRRDNMVISWAEEKSRTGGSQVYRLEGYSNLFKALIGHPYAPFSGWYARVKMDDWASVFSHGYIYSDDGSVLSYLTSSENYFYVSYRLLNAIARNSVWSDM
jgi:hypothetical protein